MAKVTTSNQNGDAESASGASGKAKASRKSIIFMALGFFVIVVVGIVGYYWVEGIFYVATDDARVAANTVAISPEINGRILEWQVREGDMVQTGDLLGRQDLATLLTSAAVNPLAMSNTGGVLAEKAQFKSPISGQVIQSNAVVGQMASPGQTLAVIADTEHLFISANIKEEEIHKVQIGQEVDVSIDALPGQVFRGQVQSLDRATASTFSLLPSQNSSGNYTKVSQIIAIKIHLVDTGTQSLLVGMNAGIRIHVRSSAQ